MALTVIACAVMNHGCNGVLGLVPQYGLESNVSPKTKFKPLFFITLIAIAPRTLAQITIPPQPFTLITSSLEVTLTAIADDVRDAQTETHAPDAQAIAHAVNYSNSAEAYMAGVSTAYLAAAGNPGQHRLHIGGEVSGQAVSGGGVSGYATGNVTVALGGVPVGSYLVAGDLSAVGGQVAHSIFSSVVHNNQTKAMFWYSGGGVYGFTTMINAGTGNEETEWFFRSASDPATGDPTLLPPASSELHRSETVLFSFYMGKGDVVSATHQIDVADDSAPSFSGRAIALERVWVH